VATKKTTNGDRQGMSKAIRHALTIANFMIDRPAPLEINCKIATEGGGDSHHVEKSASLCLASVFFWGILVHGKIRSPARKKKYWREDLGWTPN